MKIVALFAVLALAACGSPTWTQNKTVNKARKNVMITFTDASLQPSEAHVLAGGNVSWINYSTMYVGTVFLAAEAASAMGCQQMRPLFSEVAGGYLSMPITEDSDDVTLPCSPASGTYAYELRLGQPGDFENYQTTMKGSIVVEAAP